MVLSALVLRSLGIRYRVGRLLASAPQVSIDEAHELARSGEPRFVRMTGRITSDEEFPDDQDRPLVFRRTRLELADERGGWQRVLDDREAVTFGIEARSAYVEVDNAALDEGLVVIPRESTGQLRDIPAEMAATLPEAATEALDRSTPVRLVIEQVSAVEHATVAGRPTERDGRPVITSGLGRPLIVTTLDPAAAMRVLASGRRGRLLLAALLLIGGFGLLVAAVVTLLIGA